MKLNLFECVILIHPCAGNVESRTLLLKGPFALLAKDIETARLKAACQVPAPYDIQFDGVEILIRPFV